MGVSANLGTPKVDEQDQISKQRNVVYTNCLTTQMKEVTSHSKSLKEFEHSASRQYLYNQNSKSPYVGALSYVILMNFGLHSVHATRVLRPHIGHWSLTVSRPASLSIQTISEGPYS